MQFELGKMDFGTILDRGVKLFKTNFVPMVILLAIFFGPFIFAINMCMTLVEDKLGSSDFITDLMNTAMGNSVESEEADDFEDIFKDPELLMIFGVSMLLMMLMLLITPLVYLGIYRILSEHILGRAPPMGDIIRFAAGKYWTLLGAIIVCNLILSVVGGFLSILLLGIGTAISGSYVTGGVLYFLFFSVIGTGYMIFNILLPCVVCMENVPVTTALKRTWWLLRGFWWRTFGIYFLAALLVGIITQIFLGIGQGIGGLIPGLAGNAFVAAVSTLFSLTFQPFTLTIIFLIYLDIRIRKENFDLDILASHSFNTELNETVQS